METIIMTGVKSKGWLYENCKMRSASDATIRIVSTWESNAFLDGDVKNTKALASPLQ